MADDIVAWLHNASHNYEMYRCEEAANEIVRLREVLYEWDALIEHQYTGSREAMSDMTYAAQATAALLYGEAPWPQKTRVEKQADEIERLRKACYNCDPLADKKIVGLMVEIERLRAALGEITNASNELRNAAPSDYARGFNDGRWRMQQIARAALAGEKADE